MNTFLALALLSLLGLALAQPPQDIIDACPGVDFAALDDDAAEADAKMASAIAMCNNNACLQAVVSAADSAQERTEIEGMCVMASAMVTLEPFCPDVNLMALFDDENAAHAGAKAAACCLAGCKTALAGIMTAMGEEENAVEQGCAEVTCAADNGDAVDNSATNCEMMDDFCESSDCAAMRAMAVEAAPICALVAACQEVDFSVNLNSVEAHFNSDAFKQDVCEDNACKAYLIDNAALYDTSEDEVEEECASVSGAQELSRPFFALLAAALLSFAFLR